MSIVAGYKTQLLNSVWLLLPCSPPHDAGRPVKHMYMCLRNTSSPTLKKLYLTLYSSRPSDVSSGPKNSAVFLHRTDVWLPTCGHINYSITSVFFVVPSEGLNVTDISTLGLYALTFQGVTIFTIYHNIIWYRWWKNYIAILCGEVFFELLSWSWA